MHFFPWIWLVPIHDSGTDTYGNRLSVCLSVCLCVRVFVCIPFWLRRLVSTGLKWMVGIGQTSCIGSASIRQAFFMSQPAPCRYRPFTSTPSYSSHNTVAGTANNNDKKAQLSLGKTRYSLNSSCCSTDLQGHPRSFNCSMPLPLGWALLMLTRRIDWRFSWDELANQAIMLIVQELFLVVF